MDKITEIIPDDIPEWAQQAMDEGQLFRVCIERAENINWRHKVAFMFGYVAGTVGAALVITLVVL